MGGAVGVRLCLTAEARHNSRAQTPRLIRSEAVSRSHTLPMADVGSVLEAERHRGAYSS
jgi:hypothetical protein